MPLSQRSIVFICLIFSTLQSLATGLICYDCLVCDTVNGNTGTTTVANNASYSCYKITATLLGASAVNRGALLSCQAGTSSIGGVSGTLSCCTSDRCNSGIALSSSFGLAFVLGAIIMVFHATIIH